MADAIFSHPRLAAVYDALEGERSDLNVYLDLAADTFASIVFDVGSGTGCLAERLVQRGVTVLGFDPAEASVRIARTKVPSPLARFTVGTAHDAAADPANQRAFDLATMTANVAQVFVEDDDWTQNLTAIRACLRPGGSLAFEARKPSARAWEGWTKALTRQTVDVDGEVTVEDWVEVTAVDGERVTFQSPTIFHSDGVRIESTSTLRFRGKDSLRESLERAGFTGIEFRDLPYAPTKAWLILARA